MFSFNSYVCIASKKCFMKSKNIILFLNLISFLILASSGLLLYFYFTDSVYVKIFGRAKDWWLNVHSITAVIMILLVFHHLGERWFWVEQIILRKSNKTPTERTIGKRRNNSWFFIILSISFVTGFISWILDNECEFCAIIHKNSGIIMIFIFLGHLIKHRFPSTNHFK